jgi:hypothetical protein
MLLKKNLRGTRKIERRLEARNDQHAGVVTAYSLPVRSALTNDGRPPLVASGLRLKQRVEQIGASLDHVCVARPLGPNSMFVMRPGGSSCGSDGVLPPSFSSSRINFSGKLYRRRKKVAAGATLVLLDEVGFSLKGTVKHTWALHGQTPVVFAKASWDKGSTLGAVTSAGQFLQHTQHGAFKGEGVIRFLQHVVTHVPGEVVVVLDNAGIHKTMAVTAFAASQERLSLRYLTP